MWKIPLLGRPDYVISLKKAAQLHGAAFLPCYNNINEILLQLFVYFIAFSNGIYTPILI